MIRPDGKRYCVACGETVDNDHRITCPGCHRVLLPITRTQVPSEEVRSLTHEVYELVSILEKKQ